MDCFLLQQKLCSHGMLLFTIAHAPDLIIGHLPIYALDRGGIILLLVAVV